MLQKDPFSVVPWVVIARIDLILIYIDFAIDLFENGERNPFKILSVIMFIVTATFFIYCVDKYLKVLRQKVELDDLFLITTGKLKFIALQIL